MASKYSVVCGRKHNLTQNLKNKRRTYLIIILIIIVLGILSRKISIIPLCIGDILYAIMIYFIIRMCFVNLKIYQIALISLVICFLIECSQLYQESWIFELRKTLLGHYVLGQGFLWSDLIAYVFGISIAYLLDKKVKSQV